jgi:hypothetical protein
VVLHVETLEGCRGRNTLWGSGMVAEGEHGGDGGGSSSSGDDGSGSRGSSSGTITQDNSVVPPNGATVRSAYTMTIPSTHSRI